MARGWESKSVEDQIESAAAQVRVVPPPALSPQQIEIMRTREHLELSRTRVKRELESSSNPRYQQMMRKALDDLETKLAQLAPARKAAAG